MDIHLFYLLPLLPVFIGFALHLWMNSNLKCPHSSHHLLYVPNLGIDDSVESFVQPILRIIRTVRRKLLITGDSDEEAPSFVLL